MSNPTDEKKKKKSTWSTWDELLLAFAVKRHGLQDWGSVAMELRTRTSLPDPLTPQLCKDKYRDLHCRFMNSDTFVTDHDADARNGAAADIPWLEKLRQLRVSELRQEVHRYDLSIQSLQQKVKQMEEERDQSFNDSRNDAVKPDLEDDKTKKSSVNEQINGDKESPEKAPGNSVSVAASDHENRSFNESNSTEKWETEVKAEPESNEGREIKPDLERKPVGEEDSCNDSSDRREESDRTQDTKPEKQLAAEMRDVLGPSKESSDVQSTATLTKKRRKRTDLRGGGRDGGNVSAAVISPAIATKRESAERPEPFVGLLGMIRSRKHASMFERRLDIQKTERYKSIIRRHVDFETVQYRINHGFYSGCPIKFYLDLLLLFNNAIVFFPKSTPEWTSAQEFRRIVMKDLKNNNRISSSSSMKIQPQPEPERPHSFLAKHKSAIPIVVCRKRSTVSANKQENEKTAVKPCPNTALPSPPEDDNSSVKKLKSKSKVKAVKGMRNGRSLTTKVEDKKQGAAEFLKRIKKNSPAKVDCRRVQHKRKPTDERKGGPVVGENRPSKEDSSKRPQKRPRR